MGKSRKEIGDLAEKIACKYLWVSGYDIRERNVYFREGEIDIVAEKFGVLYLIEVRSKISGKYLPVESLDENKLERMQKAAELYCYSISFSGKYRIEIIGIEILRSGGVRKLIHYKDLLIL